MARWIGMALVLTTVGCTAPVREFSPVGFADLACGEAKAELWEVKKRQALMAASKRRQIAWRLRQESRVLTRIVQRCSEESP